MLETLKTVHWEELSHAYGQANDIPELLLALTSGEQIARERAIETLFTNIYHQGTVYQASAYAAPFLIELLTHEKVQGKEDLLFLLAHLARGDGYHHQHLDLSSEEEIQSPQFQEEMAEQLFWVRKTHEAVSEGKDIYIALLEHPDIRVKMGAAYLLAHLQEYAPQTIPLLYALFKSEGDERVKANLIFSLAALDLQSVRGYQFVKELATRADNLLLQFVAALVTVKSGRNDIPHRVIDLLIQVAMPKIEVGEAYGWIPWGQWKANYQAVWAFQWLSPQPARYTINQLITALHTYLTGVAKETGIDIWQYRSSKDFLAVIVDKATRTEGGNDDSGRHMNVDLNLAQYAREVPTTVAETIKVAFHLAFRNEKLKDGTCLQDLSLEQQLVLKTLVDCGLAWRCTGGRRDSMTGEWVDTIRCAADLHHVGLPSTQEGLRAFLQQMW